MNNNFSENIKKIRKENNLTQEQLAEELGVSRQAISKWESGAAYPEMDKIISICKKYNCNIDDLLHRDIKEVKGEEEAKKTANNYIEAFFKFITDSINMFLRMNFGNKAKCVFDQFVIAFILMIAGKIIFGISTTVMSRSILGSLPKGIYFRIENFYESVYVLLALIIAIIIMVRIFKERYLNYYEEIKEDNNIDSPTGKIELKKDSKIIVRDPKNSDYHFLRGLLKIFLIGIKIAALWFALSLIPALVFVGIGFVLSFLVYKTGIFFIGCLLGCISVGIILSIILLALINFVFNRKSDKKKMIWSFVISIIVVGISIGMVMIGSLQFDVINEPVATKTDTFEIAMADNLLFGDYHSINYVTEERNNIRVEYLFDSNLTSSYNINSNGVIHIYNYTDNHMKLIRNYLKQLNDKKIGPFDNSFEAVTVYANSANIEKLKTNHDKYFNTINNQNQRINELEEEIENKNRVIEELTEKVNELENNNIEE